MWCADTSRLLATPTTALKCAATSCEATAAVVHIATLLMLGRRSGLALVSRQGALGVGPLHCCTGICSDRPMYHDQKHVVQHSPRHHMQAGACAWCLNCQTLVMPASSWTRCGPLYRAEVWFNVDSRQPCQLLAITEPQVHDSKGEKERGGIVV